MTAACFAFQRDAQKPRAAVKTVRGSVRVRSFLDFFDYGGRFRFYLWRVFRIHYIYGVIGKLFLGEFTGTGRIGICDGNGIRVGRLFSGRLFCRGAVPASFISG